MRATMLEVQSAPLRPEPARLGSAQSWAVVLAGGDGVRLRPLVRRIFGDERPKQYIPLLGPVSLLRQTLDRVGRLVPPERTVVVSRAEHASHLAHELAQDPATRVLLQPLDRGTGMAVLFAAHWIRQWDPDATVTVFPSDHFILEENDFVNHTAEAMAFAARHPDRLVLLGAPPTHPETEYGWISPGESLGRTSTGPVSAVKAFWEKPDAENARRCLRTGWLWSTFVFTTTLPTLLDLGKSLLPAVDARLSQLAVFSRTNEDWAIRQTFALAPTCDFSRAVLQQCPPGMAVAPLPRLTWSDLGTPARVLDTAQNLPVRPTWMSGGRRTLSTLAAALQGN